MLFECVSCNPSAPNRPHLRRGGPARVQAAARGAGLLRHLHPQELRVLPPVHAAVLPGGAARSNSEHQATMCCDRVLCGPPSADFHDTRTLLIMVCPAGPGVHRPRQVHAPGGVGPQGHGLLQLHVRRLAQAWVLHAYVHIYSCWDWFLVSGSACPACTCIHASPPSSLHPDSMILQGQACARAAQ